MIRFKPEVRIRLLTPALATMFAAAGEWSLVSGVGVEVNAVDESVTLHKVGTLHGWSLAADLDTVGDQADDTRALAEYLRRVLPLGFDVVLEGDHVHVEYDAKRPRFS